MAADQGRARTHELAPRLYLTLGADGAALEDNQRSLTRRVAVTLTALLWVLAVPLWWAATAQGSTSEGPPQATIAHEDDDEDNSGSGSDSSGSGPSGSGDDLPELDDDSSGSGSDDH